MQPLGEIDGFTYASAAPSCAHPYLLPHVLDILRRTLPDGGQIFDLGCGNGSVAAVLSKAGYEICGVDPSHEGLEQANIAHPELRLEVGSAYDDLSARFGRFPVVISLEVIEHVYAPRSVVATMFDLLEEGGTLIISTPYHSYLKNLVLALSGRMDAHFTALWDHGHIKFWSVRTLRTLLCEAGFNEPRVIRAGRVPPLAKSMIAIATKPGSPKEGSRAGSDQKPT